MPLDRRGRSGGRRSRSSCGVRLDSAARRLRARAGTIVSARWLLARQLDADQAAGSRSSSSASSRRGCPCRPRRRAGASWLAAAHVLDRHGAESGRELAHGGGRLALAGDEAVAGVERERQARQVARRGEPSRRRSRPACRAPAPARRRRRARSACASTRATPSSEPGAGLLAVRRRAAARRPRTTRPRAPRIGGDVDAARRRNATRRARPSALGVTSVGSCLARGSSRKRAPVSTTAAEAERVEAARRAPRSRRGQVRRQRVEVVEVEGERDAVVAGVGDQRDRVVEAVVGGAVGVVGEAQASSAPPLRAPARRSGPLSR